MSLGIGIYRYSLTFHQWKEPDLKIHKLLIIRTKSVTLKTMNRVKSNILSLLDYNRITGL
jgi:hypothetical protein